ncbi:PucR family transcriptional regulator [Micrococcus luteus]|uniref:PucR family transcriptional regulator n=1 Tax=Micrococcus luteus TaxID=1270 RepID=UPI000D50520E|nr:helix-turn-helix domain-containing protein [Micrococcus luteus]AWD24414.1 hypothetical protein C0205_04150 [Micrococcus luteus]
MPRVSETVPRAGRDTRGDPAALERLLDRITADDSLIGETLSTLRDRLPGYELVPDDALAAAVVRNVELSRRWLLEGQDVSSAPIPEAEELVAERRSQGVPVGTVLTGFRLCMSLILARAVHDAPADGLSPAEILEVVARLTALGDAFSTRVLVAHHEADVARAASDVARRSAWVRDVLTTRMDPAALRAGAESHGLPAQVRVRALRARTARPHDDGAHAVAERALDAWGRAHGLRVLTAPRGQDVVGLVTDAAGRSGGCHDATERAVLAGDVAVLALGMPVALDALPDSFLDAGRVIEAAEATGLAGVVDRERLGWRAAVADSPETTELLVARHLAPLREAGDFAVPILEALRAYLDHGLSASAAAAAIPVHENTLRHRLRRYRELTGFDPHAADTIVELRWVLQARPLWDPTTDPRAG